MIRCMISRGSSTARLFKTANRNYYSTSSSSSETLPGLKQVLRDSNITIGSHYEANRTSQSSIDGINGTNGVANGQHSGLVLGDWEKYLGSSLDKLDLPASPFMDPEAIEAKSQWHSPKARPSDNPTEFQIQLAKNPYAQMLATPIRHCHGTKALLPSFFLQEFDVVGHPVSKRPWMVPQNLTKTYGSGSQTATSLLDRHQRSNEPFVQTGKDNEDMPSESSELKSRTVGPSGKLAVPAANFKSPDIETLSTTGMNITQSTTTSPRIASGPHDVSSTKPYSRNSQIGVSYYVMSRQQLIRSFSERGSGYEDQWTQMSSDRIKKSVSARHIKEATKWRKDMDTFILELMRRRLGEHLHYLAYLKRGYVSGSASWEEATLPKRQAGAILWTGPYTLEPHDLVQDGFAEQITVPEFSTLESGKEKKKVAVFNLRRLLGSEHLARLRENNPIFQNEIVIIRDKRMTIDMRMRLWKVEGYMANYAHYAPGAI